MECRWTTHSGVVTPSICSVRVAVRGLEIWSTLYAFICRGVLHSRRNCVYMTHIMTDDGNVCFCSLHTVVLVSSIYALYASVSRPTLQHMNMCDPSISDHSSRALEGSSDRNDARTPCAHSVGSPMFNSNTDQRVSVTYAMNNISYSY